jgi:hypothetical protein
MPETRKYEGKLNSLLRLWEESAEGFSFAGAVLFREVCERFTRVTESF